MYVQRNIQVRSRKYCCSGKPISITHSGCVFVGVFIQHTKRMRRVILSALARL